jgi:hypothetical protein
MTVEVVSNATCCPRCNHAVGDRGQRGQQVAFDTLGRLGNRRLGRRCARSTRALPAFVYQERERTLRIELIVLSPTNVDADGNPGSSGIVVPLHRQRLPPGRPCRAVSAWWCRVSLADWRCVCLQPSRWLGPENLELSRAQSMHRASCYVVALSLERTPGRRHWSAGSRSEIWRVRGQSWRGRFGRPAGRSLNADRALLFPVPRSEHLVLKNPEPRTPPRAPPVFSFCGPRYSACSCSGGASREVGVAKACESCAYTCC